MDRVCPKCGKPLDQCVCDKAKNAKSDDDDKTDNYLDKWGRQTVE